MSKCLAAVAVAVCLASGACSPGKQQHDPSSDVDLYPRSLPPVATSSAAVPSPATAKPPAEVRKRAKPIPPRKRRLPALEDPAHIPTGIEYDEMVRRFGRPSMMVTRGPGRASLSYATRGSRVQVEMQDGKVISVAAASTGL